MPLNLLVSAIYTMLSLAPFLWLRGDFLLRPEEYYLVDYSVIYDQYRYAWSSFANYGGPASYWNHTLLWPQGFLFKFLGLIGVSPATTLKIYYSLILALILWSVSRLLKMFIRDRWAVLGGTALYVMNYHFTTVAFYTVKLDHMILMPLVFTCFARYLETGKYRYAALHFLAIFTFQGLFANAPQLIVVLLMGPLAFLYHGYRHSISPAVLLRQKGKASVLFWGITAPIFFYQGLVYYFSAFQIFDRLVDWSHQTCSYSFMHVVADLSRVFQLRGYHYEFGSFGDVPFSHFLAFYDHPVIILAGYALLMIALSPALRLGRMAVEDRKTILLFLWVYISAVAFASGFKFQTYWYAYLFRYVPFFYIFRDPWTKFMPLVAMAQAVLFAFALSQWRGRMGHLKTAALLLVAVVGMTHFSTDYFDRTHHSWHQIYIRPPSYWWEYKRWSAARPNLHVLAFPEATGSFHYDWYPDGEGNGSMPLYAILGRQNILFRSDMPNLASFEPYRDMVNAIPPSQRHQITKLGPVDFLLDQRDLKPELYDRQVLAGRDLLRSFDLENGISFGDRLFLHPIRPESYLPLIYVPRRLVWTNQALEGASRRLAFPWNEIRTAVLSDPSKDPRTGGGPKGIDEVLWVCDPEKTAQDNDHSSTMETWDYTAVLPETGPYEALLLKRDLRGEPLSILGMNLEMPSPVDSLGKANLVTEGASFGRLVASTERPLHLRLNLGPFRNLVDTGSWARLLPVQEGDTDIHPIPFYSMDLSGSYPIRSWSPSEGYRVVLEYPKNLGEVGLALSEGKPCRFWKDKSIELLPDGPQVQWCDRPIPINGREELPPDRRGPERVRVVAEIRSDPQADRARIGVRIPGRGTLDPDKDGIHLSVQRLLNPLLVLRKGGHGIDDRKGDIPRIRFIRIDPSRYRVKVENAHEPFVLVFNQNYNRFWRVIPLVGTESRYGSWERMPTRGFFGNEILEHQNPKDEIRFSPFENWGRKPIAADRHWMADGYANAWWIDPMEIGDPEDFELCVEYWPQRLFDVGWWLMAATALGCAIMLAAGLFRERPGRRPS